MRLRHALGGLFLVSAGLLAQAPVAAAATPDPVPLLKSRGCDTLTGRVAALEGPAVLLPSYDPPPADPALAGAAFTYDNALAVLALLACDAVPEARRVGEALRRATVSDRVAPPLGRLRNAYRAGPQPETPPPHGWWDATRQAWLEDDTQVGTATGNVAWAGLALVALGEATHDPGFTAAAAQLGQWIMTHTQDTKGPGGFTGGVHGNDQGAQRLTWKSTEHAIDAEALFRRLLAVGAPGPWAKGRDHARAFVQALWDEPSGHFLTGTTPDGVTPNTGSSGLDAQLWAQLLPEAPPAWARALDYARTAHGVPGGYAFNNDRAGLWTEGTAQAALALAVRGRPANAEMASVAAQISPTGYLWATPEERLSTGLALGPASTTADFFYYKIPHLGATAWAVLAATRWNPFTGQALTVGSR
ncbi:hypothetical protein [Pararhodospirillum photometricum]|nr:hypothetical protein [Pararhodospirillum photometricum]